jgi:dTDP-4-dehydrorhamnose reductase
MTKILLFGKGGQVGWELQRSLVPLGEVIALDFDSTDLCGDFTNLAGLADTVRAIKPDVIVNAGAHTAVDKGEAEPELVRTVNALAPGALATAAANIGAWLVHYSTDYVFDGSGSKPWLETDTPAPLSVYGRTKLEGEQLIQSSGCKHLIFRTSWVYAARGDNFAKTMIRLAQERETLKVVDDQIGAPTSAELLADVTAHAMRHVLARPNATATDLNGVYHLVAGGHTSWFEYAKEVLASVPIAKCDIKIIAKLIEPVPSAFYPAAAQRPLNSRLDTTKLQKTFDLTLPHWKPGVARMLTEFLEPQQ